MNSTIRRELMLAPIDMQHEIPIEAHGQVLDYVERELSNNATTLVHIDFRGAPKFFHVMYFRRAVGTLPARHLFVLKWLRMMEYAGLVKPVVPECGYEDYLAQIYAGVLNGDGKASVMFEPTKEGGSWFAENRDMVQQKCLDYFTPHFDDVFSDTINMINSYISAWPDTPIADFARSQLNGRSSGWATSR